MGPNDHVTCMCHSFQIVLMQRLVSSPDLYLQMELYPLFVVWHRDKLPDRHAEAKCEKWGML